MNWLNLNRKNILIIAILVFFSLPAIFPLLKAGFFMTDDGEWMVIRFSAFYQALRDGQFPVRFLGRLNNGYGYPVATFLYPGFMYLGIPIHILGFNFVSTIKVILGISMIGSAVFTYLWLSKMFSKLPSIIASLFYLYTPYHMYDLYKRGSVGEVLSLAIAPFIFWQIERKSFFWISIGIASLILAHNTLAFLFLPLIAIYMFIRSRKNIIYYLLFTILGLGIASFFWIAAAFELPFTQFRNVTVSNPKEYFAGIELIGLSTIVVLLAAVQLYVFSRKFKSFAKVEPFSKRIFLLFLIIGVLSTFASTKLSFLFWNYIPSSFIQFPFRLLSVTLLSVAFCTAYVLSLIKSYTKYFVLAFILVLVFSTYPYLAPKSYFEKTDFAYSTNEATTTVKNEYMPLWVKEKPSEHFKEKVVPLSSESFVSNSKYNNKNISFQVDNQKDTKISINTIYWPGWKAYVNERETEIDYENSRGVMQVLIPSGKNQVRLIFTETPLRLFADLISIVSLLILVAFTFKRKLIR